MLLVDCGQRGQSADCPHHLHQAVQLLCMYFLMHVKTNMLAMGGSCITGCRVYLQNCTCPDGPHLLIYTANSSYSQPPNTASNLQLQASISTIPMIIRYTNKHRHHNQIKHIHTLCITEQASDMVQTHGHAITILQPQLVAGGWLVMQAWL